MELQWKDSLALVKGDAVLITADYKPTGRVGRMLARFYQPQEKMTLTVVDISVVDGLPMVKLGMTDG